MTRRGRLPILTTEALRTAPTGHAYEPLFYCLKYLLLLHGSNAMAQWPHSWLAAMTLLAVVELAFLIHVLVSVVVKRFGALYSCYILSARECRAG